ncbi:MAG: hypothetical protein ACOX8E_02535 [Ruminococcus sp.]|jgi:hypothetical protein
MEFSGLIREVGARPDWMVIVCIAAAALNCIFGYKLVRFWISLTGFLIGGVIGYMALNQYVNNIGYAILAGFLLGLLVSFLAWRFYLAGVFFMVFIMVLSLFLRIFPEETVYQILLMVVSLAAALAAGILAVKLVRPTVIITSAVSGGISAAADLFLLLNRQDPVRILAAGILFAAVGAGIQFLTTGEKKTG